MEERPAGAAEEERVLRDLLAYYAARGAEGRLAACDEAALKARARRLLEPRRRRGGLDVRGVAERCRRARGQRGGGGGVLRDLLKALEVLELLCVNLLLAPWRKEIRSLKTFTGNFVYYIQSVLPDDIVKTVLEKIGYIATTETEFSLVRKRNNEETKQTAFEIFLARIECETILEMTNEEKHGNLEKTLQKRTQTHWHHGNKDKEDETPLREDSENIENKENRETSLCLATQPKSSTNSDKSFEAAGNLKIKDDMPQLAVTQSTNRLQEHQRQVINTAHFPGKCSDSEDFLIEYSDIVIRQTPIFSENLSPKAFEKKPRASLSEECVLAVTAQSAVNEIRPVPLSPGASGPPAFAIFADSSCDSQNALEYEAQEVPEESIEAKINDAINCVDPDPADEPNELKSLPYKDIASVQNCGVTKEEEVCELSVTFTKLQVKDTQEDLMYPVEETGQPQSVSYATTSDRNVREFNQSKMKCTYLTNAQMQNQAAACTEPSSDLCCTTGSMEDPTTDSDSKRLLMDTPHAHAACECFRRIREPPNPTYIPPRSINVQSPSRRSTSAPGRRNLLQPDSDSPKSSEVKLENYNSKVNEIQEPYVIIDKSDQGMLCQNT
ncbi:spermatogenesis-associated protein 2-like [Aythya fuligula]|uniref:Spermatogenesis-associated protein 2-like n=1 Tax=Aythya fuligula TaxID=219594 RepID=A0A6J3DJP0_AYTFU|nr:spermatogenesis-associated protein 2-like [Aythya fuligula]